MSGSDFSDSESFNVLKEWSRITPPVDRHLATTLFGSPRRSTVLLRNDLSQTVAPTVLQGAGQNGMSVIHRPYFARSKSTIPTTVNWYESLQGLPEVGGAHRLKPVLSEKNRNDFVSKLDLIHWKVKQGNEPTSGGPPEKSVTRERSPLLGPKGVKGLSATLKPCEKLLRITIAGSDSGDSLDNHSVEPSQARPQIYPSTYSAQNVDSRVWPRATHMHRPNPSEPMDTEAAQLKPESTFQALLHSFPQGLLAEDRRKRKTLSLGASIAAQRFVYTSRAERAARDDRFASDAQSTYTRVRGDAAEIRGRLRRGAGDPVTWQTHQRDQPTPTPQRRLEMGGRAMARLAELQGSGASAARYGPHALYLPREKSGEAAAAAAAIRASVPTPTWMPAAAQCCRASRMASGGEYEASPFVAQAAAHAKKVEVEAQIVRLQERLRALAEPVAEAVSEPFVAEAAQRRAAEEESARRQLALAREALGLVREQTRLLQRLARRAAAPSPSGPVATPALNTPSWPAGSLDAESRARLASLSRPELLHILGTAGATNTLYGNEPLARLDPARLATLVASNARARAAFLRLSAPPEPGLSRCASEMAGWLVAFDCGGRLRPHDGGRTARTRSRAMGGSRSLSPLAGGAGGEAARGVTRGAAGAADMTAGSGERGPTAMDQAIFHGADLAP